MKKLPDVLYVALMNEGTVNEYLYASVDKDDGCFEHGDLVGTYRLSELSKLNIRRELSAIRKARNK